MALTSISELGYSNPIYPFTFLYEYRIVVCQTCQYACLAGEIATHLAKKHSGIGPRTRRRLAEEIKMIPNVLQSRSELPQLQYPPPTTEPIPCLAPPKLDVLQCQNCHYNNRQVQAMQEHCAESHDWVNPRGKGRPSIGYLADDDLPWIEGVACQRFFPSREGSKWFQVSLKTKRPVDQSKKKSSARKKQTTLENLTPEASTHLQQVIDRESRYREALSQPRETANDVGTDTFAATSLWLDRTQWPSIYRGSRRDVLRALARLPDRYSLNANYILGQGTLEGDPNLVSPQKDEQKISCIMGALDSVIDRCEDTIRCTSHNLLCWLLSSRLQSRREFAFNLVAERRSEVRYRRVQKQFLAFILRMYRMPGDIRREMINVMIKPEISAQLDRIWEHSIWDYLDASKGNWPAMERQRSHLSSLGGQFIGNSLNPQTGEEFNAKEDAEDAEVDDENIEAWEFEDEDDDSDDDDYGCCTNTDESMAVTHQNLFTGASGDSGTSEIDHFLEPVIGMVWSDLVLVWSRPPRLGLV